MGLKDYIKPRLTLEGQIDRLKKQGLEISDERVARHVLKIVGYYRLSGYLLPFKYPHQPAINAPRSFVTGATFSKVWELYQFDRELRLLLSSAIEKIEVAFRASISEVTSKEFGLFGYTQREFYRDARPYEILMRDIEKILKNRLWNRWLIDAPIIPKNEPLHPMLSQNNRRFIAIAYIILKLLKEIEPNCSWKSDLFKLFEKYPAYPGKAMGFVSEWENDFFWNI